jgi:hypothetical protein
VSSANVQAVREVAIPTLDKTLFLLGDAKSLVMNWFEAETINFSHRCHKELLGEMAATQATERVSGVKAVVDEI